MSPTTANNNGRRLTSWAPLVLTIIAMLLAGGMGYGALASSVKGHEARIQKVEHCVGEELGEIRERLVRIETLLTHAIGE